MLSEEEIVSEISPYLLKAQNGTWFATSKEQIECAAHAIAERLQEGVVWQQDFKARVEHGSGYAFEYVVLTHADSCIRGFMPKGIEDDERLHVIVRREGDGQE